MDAFKTFTKQPTRVSRIACGAGVMEMEVIISRINSNPSSKFSLPKKADLYLTGACPARPVQEVQWGGEADGGREGAFQG